MLAVQAAFEEAALLQPAQALGEGARRDPLGRGEEVGVAPFAVVVEVADDELVRMEAWRVVGLALYGVGLLPAGFALPAGLGDVAVGLTALYVARRLLRRRGRFTAWTAFGILDLVAAVALGLLNTPRSPRRRRFPRRRAPAMNEGLQTRPAIPGSEVDIEPVFGA